MMEYRGLDLTKTTLKINVREAGLLEVGDLAIFLDLLSILLVIL